MPDNDHLQLTEVLDYLKANQDCAIVHPDSTHEVAIEFDRDAKWFVQAMVKDAPDAGMQKWLKAAELETNSREFTPRFGSQAGKTFKFYTVSGYLKSAEAAARAALSMFDILWQVPTNEWLWITALQFDDREELKRPSAWPPAGR